MKPSSEAATLQQSLPDDYATRSARRVVRVCAVSAIVIGMAVLTAWTLGPSTSTLIAALTTMRVNAALGWVIAGACLLLASPTSKTARYFRLLGGSVLLVVGGVTLAEYATDVSVGIDVLLFRDWRSGIFPSGRMSPQSAIVFVLFGSATLLLDTRRGHRGLAKPFAIAIAATAILAIAGHIAGAGPRGVTWAPLGTMPVLGAVAALCCSVGLVAARPTPGLGDILFSPTLTSGIARRWLVAALSMPLITSAVGAWLIREGAGDPRTVAAITIAAVAMLTAAGVAAEAAFSQRLERKQMELERRNLAVIAELETALSEVRTLRGLLPILRALQTHSRHRGSLGTH